MASTHLKNISQNRNLPQIGVKIQKIFELPPPRSFRGDLPWYPSTDHDRILSPSLQRGHNEVLRHVPARLFRAHLDPLTDGLLRGVDVKDGDALTVANGGKGERVGIPPNATRGGPLTSYKMELQLL